MQCIRLFFLLKDNKVQHRHIQGCLMSSGIYHLLACIHYPAFLLFQPYSWEVATANYGTPWSHPILLAAAPPASIVHYVYCRSPNCSTFIRYVPCHPCLSRSLLIKESHHFQSCRPIFIQCSLKPTNQWRPRRRNHFSIFISISELVQLVKLLFVLTSKVYFTVITCSQFAENTHSFFLSCKLVTAFSFPSTQLASTHFLNIGQFKGRGAWRPLKCWKSWVYYRTAPHLNVASKFL